MNKLLIVLFALLAMHVTSLGLQTLESHDAMVKADVSTLQCDGNTYKCKVRLIFGRNNYWATWSVGVTTNP